MRVPSVLVQHGFPPTHNLCNIPQGVVRQRVEQISDQVVDSNPYSRLMALQRMGIVRDYAKIREKTVCVLALVLSECVVAVVVPA